MKYIALIFLSLILVGCISKEGLKLEYYEIGPKQANCTKSNKIKLYIYPVRALEPYQSRNIFIKNENKISMLDNSKFIAPPTSMLYKSLLEHFCYFNLIQSNLYADVKLKIIILDIFSTRHKTVITSQVLISKNNKITYDKIIRIEKKIETFNVDNIISSLNLATQDLINQIDDMLNKDLK